MADGRGRRRDMDDRRLLGDRTEGSLPDTTDDTPGQDRKAIAKAELDIEAKRRAGALEAGRGGEPTQPGALPATSDARTVEAGTTPAADTHEAHFNVGGDMGHRPPSETEEGQDETG